MNLFKILKFIFLHPFNRESRISAVLTFFRYQFSSKLFNQKLIINWVNNTKFIVSNGESGITGNLYCGLMEYVDMSFLIHYLDDTDAFYDIGANVGAYTILASGVKGAKSYPFEPVPATYNKLIDQIKINHIDNLVTPRNNGLGNEVGTLKFTNNLNCQNKVIFDLDDSDSTSVDVLTLDSIDYPNDHSFVKIDVEGYEKFIIDGGKDFFSSSNVNALIVELNGSGKNYAIDDHDLHNSIVSYGFQPIAYDPFSRKIKIMDTFNEGGNTIYVKDIGLTKKRVSTAPKIVIHTANGLII